MPFEAFSEKDLEDILYEHPWLISFDLQPVLIEGKNQWNGRQVYLPSVNGWIDLLFKDNAGRPVVVELKAVEIGIEAVGQVMQYGGALKMAIGDDRTRFENEFGDLISCPRLMLIGPSINDRALAAANMAGIDVRLYAKSPVSIAPRNWTEAIKETKALIESGEFPGITGRHELADRVWDVLNEACKIVFEHTLGGEGSSWKKVIWWDVTAPFCDFVVKHREHWIVGIFEYCPLKDEAERNRLYFNPDEFYLSIGSRDLSEKNRVKQYEELKTRNDLFPWFDLDGNFVFRLPKTLFKVDQQRELRSTFITYLQLAKEMYEESDMF